MTAEKYILYAFDVSGLLYCYKDPTDLHYKLPELNLTFGHITSAYAPKCLIVVVYL